MIYKIKDLATIKRGSSPRPINDYMTDSKSGYPWLKISDFSLHDRYVFKTKEFIKESGLKNTRYVKKGTLVVTNSATPGIPIYLGEDMCLHDGFLYFESISNKVLKDYIYYFVLANRNKLVHLGNGSVFVNLKKEILENYEIDVPDLRIQQKVTDCLSAFDEKILINNKAIENLNEQARTIFLKHLDVFDSVPSGWTKKPLDEIAEYLNGLAMQKFPPEKESESLPVLKIAELKKGYCDDDSDRCTTKIKPQYYVYDGDVIFSWSASLFLDFWCGGTAGLNQHLFKVTSKDYPKWFYYSWTQFYLDDFIREAQSKATTMGHITRDRLSNAIVLIPDKKTFEKLDKIIAPIYELVIQKKLENLSLGRMRDSALDYLFSKSQDELKGIFGNE